MKRLVARFVEIDGEYIDSLFVQAVPRVGDEVWIAREHANRRVVRVLWDYYENPTEVVVYVHLAKAGE